MNPRNRGGERKGPGGRREPRSAGTLVGTPRWRTYGEGECTRCYEPEPGFGTPLAEPASHCTRSRGKEGGPQRQDLKDKGQRVRERTRGLVANVFRQAIPAASIESYNTSDWTRHVPTQGSQSVRRLSPPPTGPVPRAKFDHTAPEAETHERDAIVHEKTGGSNDLCGSESKYDIVIKII